MELTPAEQAALEHLLPSAEQRASELLDTLVDAALEAKTRHIRTPSDGGHILRALHRLPGMTWEAISGLVGMPESTIRYWVRGVAS